MDEKKSKNDTEKPEVCPECGKLAVFIPPSEKKGKKLSIKFQCPDGHEFIKELDLK